MNACSRLLALALLLGGLQAGVQAAKPKIRISGLDRNWVRTPQFRDTSNTKATAKTEWLQFEVQYESSGGRDGWLDSVTIDWIVLMKPAGGKPMLMKRRVVYKDVQEGTHYAVTYLRPKFLLRYTGKKKPDKSSFAIYVAIRANGEKMDRKMDVRMRLPRDWYRRGEPDVRLVEGELLPRTKTPFAAMDYDFYEDIVETSP
jgi:hypothetical protein